MQETVFVALRKTISHDRLESYRHRDDDDDLELLVRYAWNIALSEALYPSLNNFEIALRNHLNNSMIQVFHSKWLTDSKILEERELKIVHKAQNKLSQKNKPPQGGHLVAELNLGFWTQLSYARYEQSIWRELFLQIEARDFFPLLPKINRKRKYISTRFHDIYQLRNRVFHHEPILPKRLNQINKLSKCHSDILEAISWIEPNFSEKTKKLDRFGSVISEGYETYKEHIKLLVALNDYCELLPTRCS